MKRIDFALNDLCNQLYHVPLSPSSTWIASLVIFLKYLSAFSLSKEKAEAIKAVLCLA